METATAASVARRFSVAPMMDWTDRHDRFFLRLISARARLYTEMITTGALIYGDRARFLAHHEREHPLAIQLGGNDPAELARSARMAEAAGFDEVNLNVGCPSDRVQSGRFGAALMAEPALVARAVQAMRAAVDIPVTVKCRIGIDGQPSDALFDFVGTVAEAGCRSFVIHARQAWLKGLDPKQNREVPPLDYPLVYRVKRDFPELEIVINGGIATLEAAAAHLDHVDGVMLGRAAYQTPYLLAEVDRRFFGAAAAPPTRRQVLEALLPYVEAECAAGTPLSAITRHILGLAHGLPGARTWRRTLSEGARRPGAGPQLILDAAAAVDFDGAAKAA